jgi:hypothetical protein
VTVDSQIDSSVTFWDAGDPQDRAAWLAAWNAWPEREVFAHPGYGELFARDHDKFMCAFYADGSDVHVLYPFILRPIDGPLIAGASQHDMISPYGYGGPYTWGAVKSNDTGDYFWAAVNAWAASHNVVSEFIRFGLRPEMFLSYPGHSVTRTTNIVRRLDVDDETLWMSFDQKVRKNVNKARRGGVTVEVDLSGLKLDEFLRLYEGTMDRRQARSDYYFGRGFFQALIDGLPGQFAFFHATQAGEIVSTELVLISQTSVYSFLGGTDSASFADRPNDLLKYEVMLWAKSHGKRSFVLGGGATSGDGIERYKRAFAPKGDVDFSTGQRILDESAYERLTDGREKEFAEANRDWPAESQFFPAYRMPL